MFLDLSLVQDVLKCLLGSGGDFAELFGEERVSCSFQSGTPEFTLKETSEAGVGLRLASGNRWCHGWCDGSDADSILSLARKLKDDMGLAGPASACLPLSPKGDQRPPALASPEQRREGIETVFDHVKQAASNASTMVSYREYCQSVLIANSAGTCISDTRHNVFCPVMCQYATGGKVSLGAWFAGGGAGLPAADDWAEAGTKAAGMAVALRGAQSPEMRAYPVILAGTSSGIFHEAVGHALEARFAHTGIFAGRLGTRIAPPVVTVADDPTLPGRGGSYMFDDEGTLAGRNVLIDHGVLVGFLTDAVSAREHGLRLTGNGRRGSYRVAPLSRMSNTYVEPGEADPGEIIESVPHGILVKSTLTGRSGALGGRFTALVSEAYTVSSGKIGQPLGFFTLSGTTLDFLGGITAVGNDLWVAPNGMCGLTPEQTIPVVSGSPTMFAGELAVSAVHSAEEVLRLM